VPDEADLPSQIGKRLAAPAEGDLELLRIFASFGFSVGIRWCSPFVRRRSWRKVKNAAGS